MDLEAILYEAILVAEKRGYKKPLDYLPIIVKPIKNPNNLCKRIFYMHRNDIIFSHEFAKAFWGEKETFTKYIDNEEKIITENEGWKYYLARMVLEKKPLKYLEKFLKTNKEE